MTPLAQRIVKDLTLPLRRRSDGDDAGVLSKMADVHCFDLTEVAGIHNDLAFKISDGQQQTGQLAFLPAPKTWIEWAYEGQGPQGFLLIADKSGRHADVYFASDCMSCDGGRPKSESWWSANEPGISLFDETANPSGSLITERVEQFDIDEVPQNQALIYAALAMINSPKIIGRRQHMPHRGLERKLVAQQKSIGKFPLHAWTEIKLHVTPPVDMSGADSVEAHLTGQRALHFCRAHLRVRLGRLEIVKAHWRGDASLGIKQSRYRLAA